MKKRIILIIAFALALFALASCQQHSDAPEGLQTGDTSDEGGYVFYVPDKWAVINSDGISAAKVSAINNTSVTFTEADVPATTVPEYFDASIASLPEGIKSTLTVTVRDEKCNFGNANGEALKYIYTYKYEDFDFACMQILLYHESRFFIFTYTSYGNVNDENSDYRRYLPVVQLAIDSFKFTERKEVADAPSYPKDDDGYNLVSDKSIAKFDLYLPDDYDVLYSGAYVKAKITDKANISLSKATSTGVSIIDYWNIRKDELSRFVTDITEIDVNRTNGVATEENKEPVNDVFFGNLDANRVASYEYTYSFNGTVYHVYQVMGVDSFSGYVFTYTATEDEYSTHIDEVKNILKKVKF